MEEKTTTILLKKKMKMSDLIDSDYHLLVLMEHLGISLCFGEKTVEMVCRDNNLDADCFLFLAKLHSNKDIINREQFASLPIEPFIQYLKSSHAMFLDYKLVNIRKKLSEVFDDKNNKVQKLMMDFFDKYYKEVKEHMHYEDEVVFPYISALINKDKNNNYSLAEFRHNDIERKVIDLKHLLMKYVDSPNQNLLYKILIELNQAQEELAFHTMIEDRLVIPRVLQIEEDSKSKK